MFDYDYNDLYRFAENTFITGSVGAPVKAIVADGIITND